MNSLTITLPLPVEELKTNKKCHWAVKDRATKAARTRACATAWQQLGVRTKPLWEKATLLYTFYYKTAAHHDDDNSIHSMKAVRDGLADAKIVANDKNFSTLTPIMLKDKDNPRVEITITKGE